MAKGSNGKPAVDRWNDEFVAPGERREIRITISKSYVGTELKIPVVVWRGVEAGPAIFVTAAVHGDEINGTGALHQLLSEPDFELRAGTLVCVPVVNLLGFERHSRYLPDRRDLNRCFPGSRRGSLASRMAHVVFREIVERCDYGIDLHTAALHRTNFPNIRADMTLPELEGMAKAFGTELLVQSKGPTGSLRRAATQRGCPTLILEAGEIWKVEPTVVANALRGIRNVLIHLDMIEGELERPDQQFVLDKTQWIRARHGGFLRFHVSPGDLVERHQPIASNTSLTGRPLNTIKAPRGGIVLGMTTLPSVAPGDPICHLAFPRKGIRWMEQALEKLDDDSLHERTRGDLATNLTVSEHESRT